MWKIMVGLELLSYLRNSDREHRGRPHYIYCVYVDHNTMIMPLCRAIKYKLATSDLFSPSLRSSLMNASKFEASLISRE